MQCDATAHGVQATLDQTNVAQVASAAELDDQATPMRYEATTTYASGTRFGVIRSVQWIHANLTDSPFQKLDHGAEPSFGSRELKSGADRDLRRLHMHTTVATASDAGEST